MFDGPWLTGRSPMPSAATTDGSRWIGFGSSSTRAIARSDSGSISSKRHGPSGRPGSDISVTPWQHPRLRRRHGNDTIRRRQAQLELEQVEDAGAAPLLAFDRPELAIYTIRLADPQRRAVLDLQRTDHRPVIRGRIGSRAYL